MKTKKELAWERKLEKDIDHSHLTDDEWYMVGVCKPYTMTSGKRLLHTFNTVKELDKNNIKGDIVECGVWRGGQIISAWLANKTTDRDFWLFDTFQGMTPPTIDDYKLNPDGSKGYAHESGKAKAGYDNWCRAELQEVVNNINPFIPQRQTHYVVGDIRETLKNPKNIPQQIALLRLDTDWYESTLSELTHLWPMVTPGGICVLDDYNSWQGSKKAFHDALGNSIKIHTIDQVAVWFRKE